MLIHIGLHQCFTKVHSVRINSSFHTYLNRRGGQTILAPQRHLNSTTTRRPRRGKTCFRDTTIFRSAHLQRLSLNVAWVAI